MCSSRGSRFRRKLALLSAYSACTRRLHRPEMNSLQHYGAVSTNRMLPLGQRASCAFSSLSSVTCIWTRPRLTYALLVVILYSQQTRQLSIRLSLSSLYQTSAYWPCAYERSSNNSNQGDATPSTLWALILMPGLAVHNGCEPLVARNFIIITNIGGLTQWLYSTYWVHTLHVISRSRGQHFVHVGNLSRPIPQTVFRCPLSYLSSRLPIQDLD